MVVQVAVEPTLVLPVALLHLLVKAMMGLQVHQLLTTLVAAVVLVLLVVFLMVVLVQQLTLFGVLLQLQVKMYQVLITTLVVVEVLLTVLVVEQVVLVAVVQEVLAVLVQRESRTLAEVVEVAVGSIAVVEQVVPV
jgi:hypothetical protein